MIEEACYRVSLISNYSSDVVQDIINAGILLRIVGTIA